MENNLFPKNNMDPNYYYFNEEVKSKRQRESNWDNKEKKFLLRLIQRYRKTIDDKRNDSTGIRRKNLAWEAIQRQMAAQGYRRGVKSVRQQWKRMKSVAKKSHIENKKEKELSPDPEVDDSDLFDEIIKEEIFESEEHEQEDEILSKNGSNDDEIALENNLLHTDPLFNDIEPSSGIGSATSSSTNCFAPEIHPEAIHRLPKLPNTYITRKHLTNNSLLNARITQIEEETSQKAEMHELEMTHRREIHTLRVQQMHDQIEQQRKLFEAQLEKLKNPT